MRRILALCPQLTDINLRIDVHPSDTTPQPITSLKTIEIDKTNHGNQQSFSIQPFIQYVPNLRRLLACKDYLTCNHLPRLLQSCPNLSLISNKCDTNKIILDRWKNKTDDEGGLQYLALEQIPSMQLLLPIWERHCHTLKGVFLKPAPSDTTHWRDLSSFALTQLTELYIDGNQVPTFVDHVALLIRRGPSLKLVALKGSYYHGTPFITPYTRDEIFDAVSKLRHLSSLTVSDLDLGGKAFLQLLERCADMQCFSELSIKSCAETLSVEALQLLTEIPSLKSLIIMDSTRRMNENDMINFTESIAGMPRLYRLLVHTMEITDTAAKNIASSKSLRQFVHCETEISPAAKYILREIAVHDHDGTRVFAVV